MWGQFRFSMLMKFCIPLIAIGHDSVGTSNLSNMSWSSGPELSACFFWIAGTFKKRNYWCSLSQTAYLTYAWFILIYVVCTAGRKWCFPYSPKILHNHHFGITKIHLIACFPLIRYYVVYSDFWCGLIHYKYVVVLF